MNYLNLVLFITAILALFYSGGVLVRSLTQIGRYMQLSEYVVSFILVAFATSLPELFVGVNSALRGASLLSLGNLIGANVLNISFVLGIAIIFARGLDISRPVEKEDMILVLGIMAMPVVMAIDKVISRLDGLVLLSVFVGYIFYLIKTEHRKDIFNNIQTAEIIKINPVRQFIIFIFGAVILLASSSFVVSYGLNLARILALPLFVVGILISIGTTLPEVIFSVKSVSMKHGSMSLGNVFGSIVVNIAFILGIVAVISPITIERLPRITLGALSAVILVGFIQLVSRLKGRLSYGTGITLVFVAMLFVLIEALIK